MSSVSYSFGDYATVEVDTDTGAMTCTCPEVDPHGAMNVAEGVLLPCIVTRWVADHYPPP